MSGDRKISSGVLKRVEPDGFGVVQFVDSNITGWFANTDLKYPQVFSALKEGMMLYFEFDDERDRSTTASTVIHISSVTSITGK